MRGGRRKGKRSVEAGRIASRVGLPALVIIIADNQEMNARHLSEIGAVRYLGRYSDVGVTDIARNLKQMIDDRAMTERMQVAMKSLVDASGTERVVQALLGS